MIVQHCVNRKLKAHSPEAPAEEEESEHNLKVEGRDSFTCKYIVLDSTRPLQITLSVYWSVITVSSLVFFCFFFKATTNQNKCSREPKTTRYSTLRISITDHCP